MPRLLQPLFLILYYFVYTASYVFEAIQRGSHSSKISRNVTHESIQNGISSLKQVPVHIGLVVDSKTVINSYSDLIDLMTWCIACRIQNITVHDHEGVLKQNMKVLRKELQIRNEQFFGSKVPRVKYTKSPKEHMINKDPLLLREKREVFQEPNVSIVCITSAEDGKESIARGVQKIAEAVQKGALETQEIHNFEFMNHVMTSTEDGRVWPSPDFVLKFGDSIVWNGFLPWQMRYTEILFMSKLKNISFDDLWFALKQFDNRSRRFGK